MKMTAQKLIEMAQAAGLMEGLRQALGVPGVHADGSTPESRREARMAELRKLREERDDAIKRNNMKILECEELAETIRSQAATSHGLRKDLDEAMRELKRYRDAEATRTGFETFDHAAELAEAKAEVASLQRTVDKLRRAAVQSGVAAPVAVSPDGQAVAPTIRPNGATLRVTFLAPQGFGTADRLKALGARWKRTGVAGGFWELAATTDALAVLEALRADGKRFDVIAA